jgi:two-component system LytT family response regulator
MSQIRAVIVDDEPLARRGVRQLLAAHDDFEVVAEARNGREAITAVTRLRPDLVFLDVQMPELDGFAVLKEIGPAHMPMVIFVTAYDDFAVRAFEAHAVDYLVKPIQEMRFVEAINRARQQLRSSEALALSKKLSALLQTHERQRLVVPTSTGDLLLDADEIDWIEADDYYAAVHVGNKRHLIRESLSSLDGRLDSTRFVRAHRSAIVNIDRVREVRNEAGETMLVLRNGARVPVSRRRREQVSQKIKRLGL